MRTKSYQLCNKTPHDIMRTKLMFFCEMNKYNKPYNNDYND